MSDFKELIKNKEKVSIEIGCGKEKKKGWIGIDQFSLENVDYVADIEKGLPFIPDDSIDEIYSRHVFEHIENFELLMKEIYRIVKPNGKIHIIVPHFSNPHYYSDFTHKRFFGLYTFDYMAADSKLKRKVPNFYVDFKFQILRRKLVFRSGIFFFTNQFAKRVLNPLVNLNYRF